MEEAQASLVQTAGQGRGLPFPGLSQGQLHKCHPGPRKAFLPSSSREKFSSQKLSSQVPPRSVKDRLRCARCRLQLRPTSSINTQPVLFMPSPSSPA